MFNPFGHWRRLVFLLFVLHASTFLGSFAPHPLRRFIATMSPLTPARLSLSAQVSPLHVHGLPDHSVSNHPVAPRRSFDTLPISSTGPPPFRAVQASPFPSRLAGFTRPNQVRFLRTGRSPPVASHPASRRRSYIRLQAGERMPERDSHPPDHARSRAH